MNGKVTFSLVAALCLMGTTTSLLFAGNPASRLPIAVDIDGRLKNMTPPPQRSLVPGPAGPSSTTTTSQCFGGDQTLTITIPSFDPANPGSQDVVFFRETPDPAPGSATLWVAWDFLETAYGRQDVVTCDQLAYLQGSMDAIVDTDVYYFGDYDERPPGNENIDVMIYNIVDENYFDPDFPFFIAGFFWGALNEAFDRNMIFIDTLQWEDRLGPDAAIPFDYEGTVAHELEHLIHNDHDIDEESWIDEGLADLAIYLNGFGHPQSHVVYYLAFHRTPLTTWGGGLEDYGASYLFQLYLLENFGSKTGGVWDPDWTRKMLDEQGNGIQGVVGATGAAFNDLYDAWVLANYVDVPSLTHGTFPLGYDEIDLAPFQSPVYGSWSIETAIAAIYGSDHQGNLPVSRYYGGLVSGTVEFPLGAIPPYAPLYGTYKGIQPTMNILLRGDAESGIAPYAGSYEVASGGGNLVDDRMLQLDTPVGGTLSFWTWYDIEEEWDYGFVEVSTDNGATWEPLQGSITRTSTNPNSSTAWASSLVGGQASTDTAITGSSGGWVEASFTLPAASNVLVRFSYYTDEAFNGTGWFIDEVSFGGSTDGFEADADGWTLGGWTRTTGLFDNDWSLAYLNPKYSRGRFSSLELESVDGVASGDYEFFGAILNTGKLKSDQVVVVFSNRPGASSFDANYLILVEKGPAR